MKCGSFHEQKQHRFLQVREYRNDLSFTTIIDLTAPPIQDLLKST